jgi:hypothetical protein
MAGDSRSLPRGISSGGLDRSHHPEDRQSEDEANIILHGWNWKKSGLGWQYVHISKARSYESYSCYIIIELIVGTSH